MRNVDILLIDDQLVNLVLFEALFVSLEDIETYQALSGQEAIELAQKHCFGLILSDVNMPGMDGFETVDRIRRIDGYQDISVIFITAQAFDTANILRGYQSGAVDYIAKPFENEVLISKIEIHLKLYRQKLQIEEQYRELSKRKNIFDSITSSIHEAIFITDNSGNIRYWNNSAYKIFGYNPDEVTELTIYDLIKTTTTQQFISKVFKDGKGFKSKNIVEANMADITGFDFPVEFTISEINDTEEIKNYMFVIREIITKKAEEQHRLKAKELKEANRIMSDFMDNMSHELRTPLNQIVGISSMMVKYESDRLDKEQFEAIKTISDEGEHLMSIINKILQFREPSPVKFENVLLARFTDMLNELTHKLLAKTQLTYNINVKDPMPEYVYIDTEKYFLALEEILINAVKFTSKGEVLISVYASDMDFVVQIEDSGIGINEEEINNIFNEFYQSQSNSDREYGGLGLGLALADKYIKMMNGRIQAKSKEVGSKFSIWLPIVHE